MTRMNTLLLDRAAWDLVLDAAGNIALAQPAYALAQDVASAVRLFKGELYYAPGKGIPYFEDVLGHMPPESLIKQHMVDAAEGVHGVTTARVILSALSDREVSGQVQFIDETGAENGVVFQ